MASLFKKPDSPCWWISYRSHGRWRQRSTRLRYDVAAEARQAREECARATLRELTERRTDADSRWDAWVASFFEQRYATRPATRSRYEIAWRTLRLYLDKVRIPSPAELNYNHLLDYVRWRQAPDLRGVYRACRNTAIFELKALGTVLQEAIRRGFVSANVARGLGLVKNKPREKPEITLEEEALIRRELKTMPEWMGTSFEIAMALGCRLRETALDLSQADLTRQTLRLLTKGGRQHQTVIPPSLAPLLRRLKEEGRSRACELPAMPSKDWWQFFKRLGLSHLCFHCCRVTVITRLARAGVPERVAMRYVGHASETIHRVYCRLGTEDLGPCVEALARFTPDARSVKDGNSALAKAEAPGAGA